MLSIDSKVLLFMFISCILPYVNICKKRNVLFLVSDDMRPQIGAYMGQDFPDPISPKPYTPNLDQLASKSLVLKRAHVQQAVCSPSRTSLLTGRRPDTTHVYDLDSYFRDVGGNFTTIPQYFKQNGYHSIGMGKIFHPGHASNYDDPISWSEPYFHAERYHEFDHASWTAVTREQRLKYPLPDDQIAQNAIKTLRKVSAKANAGEQPFFVAVGYHKPHLPFVFPEEFLEYYPESSIHLPKNQFVPKDFPEVAWSPCGQLAHYPDIKKLGCNLDFNSSVPAFKVLELRRAYYSALSYTDYLLGLVIKELANLGLDNNTIISFWGDHGYQLGEHNEWCKKTNFELSTHAPMMLHIPGVTDEGIVTEELTEFVDLFPTLAEAAGVPEVQLCPENSSHISLCTEGKSMMSLIKEPKSASWKKRVFSQYPREGHIMGYSMRTDRYRYTEWVHFHYAPTYKPTWDEVAAAELYDHYMDPQENVNLANNEGYKLIREGLSKYLHQGWRVTL